MFLRRFLRVVEANFRPEEGQLNYREIRRVSDGASESVWRQSPFFQTRWGGGMKNLNLNYSAPLSDLPNDRNKFLND